MLDVVIVTQREYVSPEHLDQYKENILLEDRLITDALQKRGLTFKRVGWDDPDFDWYSTKCAVIRATWDYYIRIDEFKPWLEKVSKQTTLINHYDTLKWNLDKHYLRDCEDQGVRIPNSVFLEIGFANSLEQAFGEVGWEKAVLKPCISGAARHTYVINSENVKNHESIFSELIRNEAFILQEFQNSVPVDGELTLVLIGGKYTHAVLKKAKAGDFRVQDDFGGTVHDHVATTEEIEFAEKAMSLIDPVPLYGRVDIIRDNEGRLALQELELIEPELWFRNCPQAAEMLAEEIQIKLA